MLNQSLLAFFLLLGAAMPAAPRTFENPVLKGFHPDPSLCRVGRDYYLVNSTFEYFPALPIHHSRDLVNWTLIGNVLDRDTQLDLSTVKSSQGLYAPTLRHHDGLFYLTCTVVGGKGAFVVTAKDAAGPWSDPVWLGLHNIDGDLFWDDDGTLYFTFCEGGEDGGISQVRLDPKSFKPLGEPRRVWSDPDEPWDEGPHIYKVHGRYYLLAAVGGTGDLHLQKVAVADSPSGPFKDAPRPFLTHRDRTGHPIQATGHADLFQAHDQSWWTVFLGNRQQDGYTALGRETFLAPVRWDGEGWPVAGLEHRVELSMEAPAFAGKPAKPAPEREDFNGRTLGPAWLHVRNPPRDSLSLTERRGWLRLKGTAAAPGELAPLAWTGQRLTSHAFSGRTLLEFKPGRDNEEAGLLLRASDENRLQVAVLRQGGMRHVVCRSALNGSEAVLASVPVDADAVYLEVAGGRDKVKVAWSLDNKAWKHLAAVRTKDLRFDFTGLVLGPYATGYGAPSAAPADFAWLELKAQAQDPAASQPLSIRPTPTPLAQRAQWRIAAGRAGLVDGQGRDWLPDQGYDSGETAGTGQGIGGTEDDALYQGERWNREFSYSLPVPPGRYRLRLHFAETYVAQPGQRVFSVWVNGTERIQGLDILAEAGGQARALVRELDGVEPGTDGRVSIAFKAQVQNAKVCALELLPEAP